MTPRLIRELDEVLHIHTIQGLSNISDAHVSKFVDGRMWRSKAQAWVAAHPSPAEETELAKLRAQVAAREKLVHKPAKITRRPKIARRTKKAAVTPSPIVSVVYD
jgi:hypothetical protein